MSTSNCSGVLARHMNMKDFAADHEKIEDDVEMNTGRVEVYVHKVERERTASGGKKLYTPR